MRKKSPREGRGGRRVPGGGGSVGRLSSAPREAVCRPRGSTAKLRLPLSHPDRTWSQESLCPPDTNLEGTGLKDPNTLRTDPGLPILRPQNASATLTQRARLPLGRCTGSSQSGLPLGRGSSWATYQHTDADTHWHTTRGTEVTLTQRC